MPDATKKKIAILGGGVGALSAAFALSDPAVADRYEITVYQMGWRLGGKGASGRNRDANDRIEEHGLHVWSGLYDNAFRTMRQCYEEMGRPDGAPLATWRKAFKPHTFVVLEEQYKGRWHHWPFTTPTNDQLPGDEDAHLFLPFWSYVGEAFQFVRERFKAAHKAHGKAKPVPSLLIRLLLLLAEGVVLGLYEVGGLLFRLLHVLGRLAARLFGRDGVHRWTDHLLHWIQQRFLAVVTRLVRRHWAKARPHLDDDDVRRTWIFLNFSYGNLRGLIEDDILHRGFDVLDDQDYRAWLGQYIIDDTVDGEALTLDSPLAFFIYDADFAYLDGDPDRPSFSAGVALYTLMRMGLTWKGALIWKMQAGMGDTVFTPLYRVLKKRGVRFQFFHRVKQLHLAPDGASIAAITVGEQARLAHPGQEYQPLYDVKDLACWPSKPFYDQLENGDQYRKDGVNFEAWCTPDVAEHRLVAGRDFDRVVLGISLGMLPYICKELIEASHHWKDMVDHVKTARTQGVQLWLRRTADQLGWAPGGEPLLTGYNVCPTNTWADMSHLLERESWPDTGPDAPLNLAYFCGPMKDDPPPVSTPHGPIQDCEALNQTHGDLHVRGVAHHFLDDDVAHLWPKAMDQNGGFNWSYLVDTRPGTPPNGPVRLTGQYCRANVQPTERYNLSVPGTTRYRLHPGKTDFDNLVVAGDWTWNAFNGGCVEAAVISGLLAANALSGHPARDTIVGLTFGRPHRAPHR